MLKAITKAATAICRALRERVQCKEGFIYRGETAAVAGTLALFCFSNEVDDQLNQCLVQGILISLDYATVLLH